MVMRAINSGVPVSGRPYGWLGKAVCHQVRLAMSLGLVLWRCSRDTSWARTRSTASGSKRGLVKARRRSSKASSRLTVSVRRLPRTWSRPVLKLNAIDLFSSLLWNALASKSPAPSSHTLAAR